MDPNAGAYIGAARPAEERLHADDVRQELDRIVGSVAFRDAHRLTSFLAFIVEAKLAGKGDRLKAYTIAVEALGRRPDFDPQTDPIVRVEAVRMRQALARYYAEIGGNDPVIIEVPRGGYIPTFRHCNVPPLPTEGHEAHERNAKLGPAPSAEIRGRRRELSQAIVAFHQLYKIHRERVAAMTSTIAHTRRTLTCSYELLELSANLPGAGHSSPLLLQTEHSSQFQKTWPADSRQTQRNRPAASTRGAVASLRERRGDGGDVADAADDPRLRALWI